MPTVDPVIAARSALGNATIAGDPERIAAARRDLTAAKVERAVREAVAAAPPLTEEQKAKIAALLTSGAEK